MKKSNSALIESIILSVIVLGCTWTLAIKYPSLGTGLLGINWLYISIFFLFSLHLTEIIMTIYLHRGESHRAVKFHPAVTHFFRLWMWLTTGISRRRWVAIHHLHHKYTDTEKDPHSPVIFGLRNMFFYGIEITHLSMNNEIVRNFNDIRDNDFLEKHIYEKYSNIGPFVFLFLEFLAIGIWAVPVWSAQMIMETFIATFYVNGIAHSKGYTNFEVDNTSKNVTRLGIFACGEELHNNHHANPASAQFSFRDDEFDLGWFYIRKLQSLNLATVRKNRM
ncbi:acyl-CoA desaturase [Legionella longbeachae]|uniref:acyl-CoA desaturase n=1 Tax=Legionella longbeachae TaxID=450 RepID=UPI0001BEC2D2|nr:fatty acid desaturase [Legionella longbeachae]VEE03230.1 stearoyl CoA 9-desaturase [Legionella oakridgensis]HBD7398599.1 fatty acid desaturase [Legionella pneumophila]ARB93873.1 fatty acid desaturase [Legionella longbeachae]ARM32988.1 fatty acid desaturase [Legionella longbeachae]EEZ94183.1 fatty acid desaturase family protein [Legionella longbeachae D-4968]